jgi:hypothetical protein
VLGRLVYGGALVDNGTPTQIQLVGQFGNWLTYPSLPQGDDGVDAFSTVFDQIAAIPGPDTAFNLPGVVATLTLTAVAPGLVDVNWETSGPFSLAFFGLTDAPGTSFTIVPEPASGALLGIGLLALAVRRSKYGSK